MIIFHMYISNWLCKIKHFIYLTKIDILKTRGDVFIFMALELAIVYSKEIERRRFPMQTLGEMILFFVFKM